MEVRWSVFVGTWKTCVPLSPQLATSGLIISVVQRALGRAYSGSFFLPRSILLDSHGELNSVIQDIMTLRDAGRASMACFYFDFKDVVKQKLQNLLSLLLIQLSALSDTRCGVLSQLYSSHDWGIRKPDDRIMIKCLEEMLALDTQGLTYNITDPIDEYPLISGVPSPQEVLELVGELLGLHLPDVHICVTSRPELDIQAILEPLTSHPVSLHDETGQKQDIADFLRTFVHGDRRMRR